MTGGVTMPGLQVFIPITKVDATRHEVWGVLAEEAVDKSGEIMDYATSKPFFQAWNDQFQTTTAMAGQEPSLGNLRRMHKPEVAGKFIAMDYDDEAKVIRVGAFVSDDQSWKDVEDGILTGFSVGGEYVEKWPDLLVGAVRYTCRPVEGSLVDNPCMYGATFTMIKADGQEEVRKFLETKEKGDEDMPNKVSKEKLAGFIKLFMEQGLEKAWSYEDTMQRLNEAIKAKREGSMDPWGYDCGYFYIERTYADSVVIRVSDGSGNQRMYQVPYFLDDAGAVVLGAAVEVRMDPVPVSVPAAAGIEGEEGAEAAPAAAEPAGEVGAAEAIIDTGAAKAAAPSAKTAAIQAAAAAAKAAGSDAIMEISFTVDTTLVGEALNLALRKSISDALTGGLAKAGARHSKTDMDILQNLHDAAVTLGAACAQEAAAEGEGEGAAEGTEGEDTGDGSGDGTAEGEGTEEEAKCDKCGGTMAEGKCDKCDAAQKAAGLGTPPSDDLVMKTVETAMTKALEGLELGKLAGGLETVAKTVTGLTDTVANVQKSVDAMEARLKKVEDMPAPGGPLTRMGANLTSVEKTGTLTPMSVGTIASDPEIQKAALTDLMNSTTDPVVKQAISLKLAALAIRDTPGQAIQS